MAKYTQALFSLKFFSSARNPLFILLWKIVGRLLTEKSLESYFAQAYEKKKHYSTRQFNLFKSIEEINHSNFHLCNLSVTLYD